MMSMRKRNSRVRTRSSPSGRLSVKRKAHRQAKARCALCDKLLGGVPNPSHSKLAKLSKTQKRPQRIFGGTLCYTCLSQVVKDKVRLQQGLISQEDIDFRRLKFISGMKRSFQ